MRESLVIDEALNEEKISEEAIREELSRILDSSMFIQSDRLGRFLRFTVETTLAGDSEILKEYVVGTEVYERKPPYHPSVDSIVRGEARRLRNKLKEYYESVGGDDAVLISYRLGSYVPIFRPNPRRDDGNLKDDSQSELFIEGRGIRTAVFPFVDASDGELSGACAQIITDELIHEIGRVEGFRVSAASSIAPLVAQALDLPSVARKLDAQIIFEGIVREDNNQLHITARVVNADGFLIWSERFETEPDIQSLFKVSERIASALISRVPTEKSSIRKRTAKNAWYKLRSSVNSGSDRMRLSSGR
jgi:TolB-like protein